MKIKVCGLKNPVNITATAALNPDYMGFICYNLSPRFIAQLTPGVLQTLPAQTGKTAVFVNETEANITSYINQFGFDTIQLHGNETPDFCAAFTGKVTVFKAFGVDDEFDFTRLEAYAGKVDYFLFDTKTSSHGGSGRTFNWAVLDNYKLDVPFWLSGGIAMDNLEKIKQIKHPAFYGVDLNSRFETEPGLKDVQKLEQAFKILRS